MSEMLEKQKELEQLYNKNQLIPRIRDEFVKCKDPDFVQYMTDNNIPALFGLDLLIQMHLHKRADLPTLVGLLYHHFEDAQLTCDMLKLCAEHDLMDWDIVSEKFIVIYEVSTDVQEELDRFQYPLPMVVPPLHIKNNRQSGYLLTNKSVILKNNHHTDDVCLDHLNRMNAIKLCINDDVVRMVQNRWRNHDKPKPDETLKSFNERRRQFEKYDKTARDVIKILQEASDHFYLTHSYDKRGRTYCGGHHVTYQGAAWNKAVIEFHEQEVIPL